MHLIKWTVLLSIFWILLSGFIEPLLLSFGVVSVAIVILVLKRMDDVDKEEQQIAVSLRLLRYLPWLIGQIVSSSIQVTRLIWGKPGKLSPAVTKISTADIPKDCRALYANSITITPGTLSIDLNDDEISIHALQKSSVDDLKQGGMAKKITAIWGANK